MVFFGCLSFGKTMLMQNDSAIGPSNRITFPDLFLDPFALPVILVDKSLCCFDWIPEQVQECRLWVVFWFF